MKISVKLLPALILAIALSTFLGAKRAGVWKEHKRELPKSEDIYKPQSDLDPGEAPM